MDNFYIFERELVSARPACCWREAPEKELERLLFATPEYVELTMAKRLTALLKGLDLQALFRAEKIGDELVHAKFPLVQRRGTQFRQVIKPFNLMQAEPNSIFDHGDAWVQKVRRGLAETLASQPIGK